jgi:lipopolysaccharide/colanic/teichoic acid biosynthesis glycosyltransferase
MSKILYKVVKRAFDLVFASILWLILSPFVIVIAILIKITSKGPIFVPNCIRLYRFRPFFMYKFRTMHIDGDTLLNANPELKEILENDHKIPINTDPRVTWVGKFLRSLDLDEIPQLINVILGNMSIVGPRPYMIWEIEKLIKEGNDIERENMRKIQEVKPGLTGLWQVSGRNDLTFKQRVEIEAMYARNRNLLLDLKILFKTPKILLTGKGRK